jgi:hypothetical protein
MKFIKLGIISLVVLFVAATFIGLLFPSTVIVSRAVNISAPKDSIYGYIKNLNEWKLWIDGLNDASVKIETPLKGELGNTIVNIIKDSAGSVESEWIGRGDHKQISSISLFRDSTQTQTVVQWQFVEKLKWYPWEKFGSMMNDKILGTMMEKNLNNLKALVEHTSGAKTTTGN